MSNQPQKMPHQICPECGGARVQTRVADETRWRCDGMYSTNHSFNVWICTACGYTSFYAQGFKDLARQLSEKQQGR